MVPQPQMSDRIVQARKECIIYLLCDFIFPHRGEWTDLAMQKAALEDFLRSSDLPQTVQTIHGIFIEDGSRTVEGLLEAIRTTVQQQGRSSAIRKSPAQSFFRDGHEVFRSRYWESVLGTVTDNFKNVVTRHSNSNQRDDKRHGRGLGVTETTAKVIGVKPISKIEQNDSEGKPVANGTNRGQRAIDKELTKLKTAYDNCESDRAQANAGPRKRICRESLEFSGSRTESRKLVPISVHVTSSHNEDAVVPPAPKTVACLSDDRGLQQRRSKSPSRAISKYGSLQTPPNHATVSTSAVQKYMRSLDHNLWNRLYMASQPLQSGSDAPVEFLKPASSRLLDLYKICLGDDWEAALFSLSRKVTICSTDFLVALIGAAIFAQVLSIDPPWAKTPLIAYRSQYHQREAERYFQEQQNFDVEAFHRTIAIRTAQNDAYQKDILRRAAHLEACNINQALTDHLSSQSLWSEYLKSNVLPDDIAHAVLAAVETATLLKAELDASGDEVKPIWYETGAVYDDSRMKQSEISSSVIDAKGYAINVTLLPGIERRSSGSLWAVLVPAIVHVS